MTLQLQGKLVQAPPPQLRITASAIHDAAGQQLDGNGDGQPGGDYVALLARGGAQPQVVRRIKTFSPSPAMTGLDLTSDR